LAGELGRQPGTRTFDLEDLVGLVREGRIRVPHFQRSYRWDLKDVLRLLDSIVKGYPVGSLLLWQRRAPEKSLNLGAVAIAAPAVDQALWVVDGQQRIISLVNALSDEGFADDKFAVNLDLPSMSFVAAKDADPVQYIPLPDLFDLPRLLAWFQRRPDLAEHLVRVNDVASALRKYELPAYIVQDAEPEVLQDIFDRMNSYGKRLSRAEIFSALTAPTEGEGEGLTLSGIADAVEADLSFGRVDDDTVLHVLLATRGSNVTRDIRHELAPGERAQAYEVAHRSLRRTVGFLQSVLGVPHIAFLPYRYLLVVLARFLAEHPDPAPRNEALLVRWFWRAAVLGPDRGSATGTMRALAQRIEEDDENASVQGMLAYLGNRPHERPGLRRFNASSAGSRILLNALWALKPRSVSTGEQLSHADLAQALSGRSSANQVAPTVVARAALSKEWRNSAGNRMLVGAGPADGRALREALEDLDVDRDRDVLRSHALEAVDLDLLRAGEQQQFVVRREDLLADLLATFLARVTGAAFEDTPPLESLVFDDETDDGSDDAIA